jgi:NAD(P)H-dependent FMN reductase
MPPKILVFAGSAREGSFNKKLARIAAAAAREAGAEVTFLDLRDHSLPLFDQDLEAREGEPAHATALKRLMKEHHGWIVATPEHNTTITALLKNTLDWASRRREGEKVMECFADKPVALLSASPGPYGGLRSLLALRQLLANMRMLVLPDTVSVSRADQAFDADGNLVDPKHREAVETVARKLVAVTARLTP